MMSARASPLPSVAPMPSAAASPARRTIVRRRAANGGEEDRCGMPADGAEASSATAAYGKAARKQAAPATRERLVSASAALLGLQRRGGDRCGGRPFLEQRVEKPVLIVRCAGERRQELATSRDDVGGEG